MKIMKRTLALLLSLILVASLVIFVSAEETRAEEYHWRMAIEATETSPSAVVYNTFKENLEKLSDGRITLDLYFSGTLGKGAEIAEMVKAGAIEIAVIPKTNAASYFPMSDIISLPFLATGGFTMSYEIATALHEYGFLDELDDGWHLLYVQSTAALVLSTKKPIEKPDDLKGLTISATSTGVTKILNELGATGTSINSTEVFQSLQTGVIDGCVSGPIPTLNNGYCDEASNLMNYGISGDLSYTLISDVVWQTLPDDLKLVVKEAANYAQFQYMDVMYANTKASIQKMIDKGINVYTPSEEVIDALLTAAEPVWQEVVDDLTAKGYNAQDALEAAKAVVERCGG